MPLTPGTPVKVNPTGTFIAGILRVWSTALNDWITPKQVVPVGSIPPPSSAGLMPWDPIGYVGTPKVFAHYFTQYPLQPNANTSNYWANWLPPGKVEGASATVTGTTTASSASAATTFTTSTTSAALIQVGDHLVFDGTTINGTYQVQTVNTATGVITLTTPLLDAVPSGRAYTVSRNGTDHRVYGGFTRDMSFGGSTLTTGWQVADMRTEINRAVAAGIDGFWVDLLNLDVNSSHWKNVNYLFQAADQYFAATGKRFWIAPMPDGTAGSCNASLNSSTKIVASNASADALVAALLTLKTQASYLKNANGHFSLPVFGPETLKAGYTLDDTRFNFWTRVKNGLAAGSMTVDMTFCYVGDWTTLAPTYNSLVVGHSRWGDRDYVTTAAATNQNRLAPSYCHSTFAGKKWTHFAGPMDARPYSAGTSVTAGTYRAWEGKGFLAFNNCWRAAIDGGADAMQITTWNDYGESAHISPSRNNSYALADLNYYYAHWFKNGAPPAIVRDGIYMSHRIAPVGQQTSAIPGSKQVKWAVAGNSTALVNVVDITCFLTANATIEVYVDGFQKTTFAGVAGYNRFEYALPAVGFLAVRATRSSVIVPGTTCNATFGVKTSGNITDDYHYRSYSSLRQAAVRASATTLFRDDFNGTGVDTTKWNVRNKATQSNNKGYDLAANCTVQGGYLSIHTGHNTAANAATYPWTAGYLDTIGKANGTFQEGYWEFRGRFPWGPSGYGFWPAYWLRPEDGGIGEIDIMEAWAKPNSIHQSLWRDYTGTPHVEGKLQTTGIPGFDPTQWHTYAVEKRKGVLRFYVDGLLVWDASESASWITEAFDRTVNWNIRLQLQMGDSGYGGDPTSTTDLTKTFDTDYAWVTTAPLPVS